MAEHRAFGIACCAGGVGQDATLKVISLTSGMKDGKKRRIKVEKSKDINLDHLDSLVMSLSQHSSVTRRKSWGRTD